MNRRRIQTPNIPDTTHLTEREREVVNPIKETIELREGRRGRADEAFVTWRDLVNLGLISESDIPS